MSTIANDDLFVVRRNSVLYKVYASQVSNGSTLDQYLVQRSGTLYNVQKQNLFEHLQNTDHMMIWDTSVGQLCKVSGQDARDFLFPVYDVQLLTVAGGGSLGGDHFSASSGLAGGGGAGGMVEGLISVTGTWSATIVVGAGGVIPTGFGGLQGQDGGYSSLDVTSFSGAHTQAYAYGGGGGAGRYSGNLTGRDGGSGGGGGIHLGGADTGGPGGLALSAPGYTTYGNAGADGGISAGPGTIGGGAGSSGAAGGGGRSNSITGTSVIYAAGGNSADGSPIGKAAPVSTIGTGGGRTAGYSNGGDGIVILRWPNAQGNITLNSGDAAGMTVTLDGTDRIAQFTEPGTYTVSVG